MKKRRAPASLGLASGSFLSRQLTLELCSEAYASGGTKTSHEIELGLSPKNGK